MKAKDIEQRICELVDGTLSADEAEQVRQRIKADPALAAERRLHEALSSVLDDIAAEPMPLVDWELQRQTIQSSMEREALLGVATTTWPRRLVRWSAAVTAAAAVFALLVLGRGWLVGPTTPTTPSSADGGMVRPVPMPPADQALTAAPVRPPSAVAGELVVAYSEPDDVAVATGRPDSFFAPSGRAGTIIISVTAPARRADWAWEGL